MKSGAGDELYYCKYEDSRFPVTPDGICRAKRCEGCEKYEQDIPAFVEPFVIFNYTGARVRNHPKRCCWEILCSDENLKKEVLNVFSWTKTTVESSAKIDFNKIEGREREYRLTIIGCGYDGRCRWCSSFRTRLKNRLIKIGINPPTTLDKCPYDILKDDSQV